MTRSKYLRAWWAWKISDFVEYRLRCPRLADWIERLIWR